MSADILSASIGIGLAVSLMFSELFGLAAGGMVVPGYFAVYLDQPVVVLVTALASLVTYLIVYMLGQIVIVYGRRRTVLMILVGYLVRMLFDSLQYGVLHGMEFFGGAEVAVIGYIIPGLVAIWMDRQGVLETLSTLATAAVVVRLVMILVFGNELYR
jgi:poly-gamma-glutamate biosynthesis protein PgsC/CapC